MMPGGAVGCWGALVLVAATSVAGAVAGGPPCTWIQGQDYSPTSSHGTLTATSKEACCAACQKYETCKVGVYQASSSKCYLKGGHVTPSPHLKEGILACVARHNPEPNPAFDCSTEGADCAGRLGATHWNPCYFINASAPVLIDGARSLATMGARVIKVALFSPLGNYPFNSPLWPEDGEFPTMASMAKHQYYRELWGMPDFDTYVLIAYSTVGGAAGGDISYWTSGITAAQEAEETKQLAETAVRTPHTAAHTLLCSPMLCSPMLLGVLSRGISRQDLHLRKVRALLSLLLRPAGCCWLLQAAGCCWLLAAADLC
jgi:hypothetical protein